jgi:hypothetical protein
MSDAELDAQLQPGTPPARNSARARLRGAPPGAAPPWRDARAPALRVPERASGAVRSSSEGIDFPRVREIDKAVVRTLATCRWVAEHQTVIVTGATGTGKSYFGRALAYQARCNGL